MKRKNDNTEFRHLVMFLLSLLILLSLSFAFMYVWIHYYNDEMVWSFHRRGHYLIFVLYFGLQYVFSRIYGALRVDRYRVWEVLYSQGLTTFFVDFLMYFVISLIGRKLFPPAPMLVLFVVQMGIIAIWAYIASFFFNRLYPPQKLVFLYSSHSATETVKKLALRDDQFLISEAVNVDKGFPYMQERILAYDGVVICDISGSLRNDIVKFCYDNDKCAYVVPKVSDILLRAGEELHIVDTPMWLLHNNGLTFEQRFLKRIMDILLAGIAAILTSPFMLITAIAIKAYDRGPVFYRQDRVTKDGEVFSILKFRSMIENAEQDGKSHPAENDDDRITSVGKIIRACRFDEMPQIFNILKGDMSIVGPRPERVEHVEQYTREFPEFKYRLKVKAGLTGQAQVYGKYNTSAYDKLKLDLDYIENYSVQQDIKIIFMTVKVLFMKESTEGFETPAEKK